MQLRLEIRLRGMGEVEVEVVAVVVVVRGGGGPSVTCIAAFSLCSWRSKCSFAASTAAF